MILRNNIFRKKDKLFSLKDEEEKIFEEQFNIIRSNTLLLKSHEFIQHGNTSCLLHSIAVSYYSLVLMQILHAKCDKKSLIVGSLLHDYFLYDWHEKDSSHRLHGFFHPKKAYMNACRDYHVNCVEKDIIIRHMFPLTIVPPRYKESIIVCIVDKGCSIYETFKTDPYRKLYIKWINLS
ncbi:MULTISPECIES: phosphodiesterase [Clostridium]|uniref:HD domain-containing protein n=1 Tax=Clostridium cadaveris TaxID=1529 RepID=A0A1I2PDB0_9CLOT|nr:phosphodiesterase [Clostridium cadaveris]MDM8311671.1 phosphodiesterase [Clostridium cadaveris]MDU4953073.1 phosphodiesterase [Clostridium sp.]MDY4947761.1 phosphodiesterase [Clostridium cadaveris]SFG13510.1 uncharacterized protein SAMN04487885_1289 [Clostridium cadaveris]